MASLEDKISYSLDILKKHQEMCGNLNHVVSAKAEYIECDKCGMKLKKGIESAIFELKGYKIELS